MRADTVKSHVRHKKISFFSVFLVFVILFTLWLGLLSTQTPKMTENTLAEDEFSTERAMEYLETIGQNPHPVGSPEHKKIQNYLFDELTSLGVEPEIQHSFVVSDSKGVAGSINNIIAKIEGTENSKALLLSAHYDTAIGTRGVGDNGASVAAILETVRAIKNGKPLKNDIIILLTDGEEMEDMLGAKAFIEEHDLAEEVGLVLNFEARGNKGPSMMFETSDQNQWLINEYVKGSPHPVGNSFLVYLYKYMPNDTDLSVFKEAGLPGLNFAFAEGLNTYHTSMGSLHLLDKNSLFHHGENMFYLTRHFGNQDLYDTKGNDSIFFNVIGSNTVSYSQSLVFPLTVMILLLFIATFIHGKRKNAISFRGLLGGFIVFVSTILLSYIITSMLWLMTNKSIINKVWMVTTDLFYSNIYFTGFILGTLALFILVYSLCSKKIGIWNLQLGALFLWTLLAIVTSFYFPGGSYLFHWTLFFTLIGLNISFYTGMYQSNQPSRYFYHSLFSIPGVILFTPIFYYLVVMITLDQAGLILALVSLVLGLLIPAVPLVKCKKLWVLPSILALIGLLIILTANYVMTPSEQHPNISKLDYALDIDKNKAIWYSFAEPDNFSKQFLNNDASKENLSEFHYVFPNSNAFISEAPIFTLRSSSVEVVENSVTGNKRTLSLQIKSPKETGELVIKSNGEATIHHAAINDEKYEYGKQPFKIKIVPNNTPTKLTITVDVEDQLELSFIDTQYKLPKEAFDINQTRPNYLVTYGDFSYVIQSIEFQK
ncbi:M28 family peptidase [Cytobacillus sp. IB215316]|uniref:M28 family peptidase n=1 Tax=Cytobacillus sp. IB215316 TaxID=3097354 RepID=UPI002A0D2C9D|nr:M28 family peptidase [Cytobacillus sp. IB215316]MDX8363314.1 M28 family peptidase [Cytobacillus sp. IB215316]